MMHFHEDNDQGKTPKQIEDSMRMMFICVVSLVIIAGLMVLTLLIQNIQNGN